MKKRILILALAAILVGCAIGGTMAYYTNQATATNVITSGSIDVELHEWADKKNQVPFEDVEGIMPGEAVTKIVEVENTGLNDAWIRVRVTTTAEGENVPDPLPEPLPITMDIGDKWTEKDGWYYYGEKLAPTGVTQPLFTTVSFADGMGNDWQSASFMIDITVQATQVANNGDPDGTALEAAEASWPGPTPTPEP